MSGDLTLPLGGVTFPCLPIAYTKVAEIIVKSPLSPQGNSHYLARKLISEPGGLSCGRMTGVQLCSMNIYKFD